MVDYPINPNDVHVDEQVRIECDDSTFSVDRIKKIITKHPNFLGIKVELYNGKIGRIRPGSMYKTPEQAELEKEFLSYRDCHEGEKLEFKASFLFNLKRYLYNGQKEKFREGPLEIAKTIAAFANRDGGRLYIGVKDDDREILGLGHDLELLQKYKTDGKVVLTGDESFSCNGEFQFTLNSAMKTLFVDKYDYSKNTKVYIFDINGKDLCLIKVTPSESPVILKHDGKERFYVRISDQSEPYENISRFCQYWCDHTRGVKLDSIM